jgi:hypothetical protein
MFLGLGGSRSGVSDILLSTLEIRAGRMTDKRSRIGRGRREKRETYSDWLWDPFDWCDPQR